MLNHRIVMALSAAIAILVVGRAQAQDVGDTVAPDDMWIHTIVGTGMYTLDSGWKMTSNVSLGDPPPTATLNNSYQGFVEQDGTKLMYISDPGAPGGNMTFQYIGTSFTIIGTAQNVTDGAYVGSLSAQGYHRDVYYAGNSGRYLINDTLDLGYHKVAFQLANNLTGAVIVEGINYLPPNEAHIPSQNWSWVDFYRVADNDDTFVNTEDPRLHFTGNWSVQMDAFLNWGELGRIGFGYVRGGPEAHVTVNIPVNTSMLHLMGGLQPGLAAPTITLDPPTTNGWSGDPPYTLSTDRDIEFTASLAILSLDPTLEYLLTVSCGAPTGSLITSVGLLSLHGPNGTDSSNGTDSGDDPGTDNSTDSDGTGSTAGAGNEGSRGSGTGTKVGPIVGGVVGGVIGAAVIAAIVYRVYRKRQRRPKPVIQESGITIDDPDQEYKGDGGSQTSYSSPILAKEPHWQSTDPVETLSERSLDPSMTTTYATGSQSQSPVTSPVLDRNLLTPLKPSAPGSGRPLPLTPVGQPSSSHSRSPISPLTPSTATDPRYAMPREPIRPRVEFDEDAGHIRASVVEDPVELLPPNYNPQWAEENERRREGRSSSGQRGGADGRAGATSGAEAMSRRGTIEAWPHISEALERQAAADEAAGHPSTARGA